MLKTIVLLLQKVNITNLYTINIYILQFKNLLEDKQRKL